MKTSKLILVTTIMFFAFIGFSYAQSTTANSELTQDYKIIKIHVKDAQQESGLYEAIHQQVSPEFLSLPINKHYKFKVKWHGDVYMVYGNYKHWVYLFKEEIYIGGH